MQLLLVPLVLCLLISWVHRESEINKEELHKRKMENDSIDQDANARRQHGSTN